MVFCACLRAKNTMSASRSTLFSRLFYQSAAFVAALLVTAALPAQTAADITPAALAGKTVTCTITGGNSPFESSGTFDLQLGTPAAGQYTIPVSSGNTTARTGAYTTTSGPDFINIRLNGYIANASTVEIELYPIGNGIATAVSGAGKTYFEMFGGPANKHGTFTIGGVSPGGGTPAAPAITGALAATGTVGKVFSYSAVASGSPTRWAATNLPAWLTLNTATGIFSGTPTAAGSAVIGLTATNAIGTSASVSVTITIAAAATGTSAYLGSYGGNVFFSTNGSAEAAFGTYTMTISSTGAVTLSVGSSVSTGTVNTSGVVTFVAPNTFGLSTGDIVLQRFNATGTLVSGSKYRFTGTGYTGSTGSVIAIAAPLNLVGYRGKIGASYQFSVTGATGGAVWGSDVYTDDSSVGRAAVHAGVLAVGETKTVTVTILAGQSGYPATTRNGVTTSSWGAWSGSYSFAGAGDATNVATATAIPAAAPGFVAGTGALSVGGRLVCPVTVTGGGSYSYRWYLNGVLISGAYANPYIVESVTAANSGTYAADVTNSFGTTRITAGTVTINAAGAPTFNLQPFDKVVAPGGTFALATDATGTGLAYQWFRNGVALSGETGPILLRQSVNSGDAGSYTVRVTNSAGSVTSAASVVTLSATASTLRNISVRTNAGAAQIVIPGITVSGTGSKRVIIRAVGPGLAQFGLTGVMADPKLAVYDGSTKIAENDTWDGSASTSATFAAVGAFPLTSGSKDAALVTNLTASASGRGYTIQVSSANAQGGIVLIEVYDADTAPTSKLSNVSVRSISAPGADVLIMGLSLQGTGKRTLLIRGIGPTLAGFGVGGTLVDPKLTIFDSNSRELLANNDWSNADFASEMVQAQTFVGAFPLLAASKDSSTLALLDAGGYTLQVSGNDNGTGEALVEVYEIP